MTRQWLSMRVDSVDDVSAAAGVFRSADPNGEWYFLPHNGAFVPLAFHATATARARLADIAPGRPGAAPGDLPVHHASSELALALRAHDVENLLVGHLAEVTAGLTTGDRAAFLFHCWQLCSAELEPADRVRLARRADVLAKEATTQTAIPPHALAAWHRYLTALRASYTTNYSLFRHSQLTHERLGVPAADQALAARVLRGIHIDIELTKAA